MATSGTYNFAPSAGDLLLNALDRIGIRPPVIDQDIMANAMMEANFLQLEWQNNGVSLWTVEPSDSPTTITLVPGQATYPINANVVMMLNVVIRITNGNPSTPTDRFISPISQTDYMAQANKLQPGFPTSYWFNRQRNAQTVTLWPVPDATQPYQLRFYSYRWIQDASLVNGLQPEVPNLFLDAWTAGLAWRMARIYARDLEQLRKADYEESWRIAARQNTENTPMYISPMVSAYYRI